jgi:lipopolysaccharide export system protein LptA
MLVRDDAPTPTSAPATAPAATARPLGGLPGATAFEWQKDFAFDENTNRATMTGDVVIVHQDLATDPKPFRLQAAQVTADVMPRQPSPATRSSDPNHDRPSTEASDFRVKRLAASGDVRFTSQQIQFSSDQMEYDPATQTLVARGSERLPAQIYDEKGVSNGSFDEVWYNTQTEQIRLKKPQAHIRR